MNISIFLLLIAVLIASLFALMSKTKEPKYKVITSKDPIELRYYEPMLLAEVEVGGERKEAIKKGFKKLADYIFGNNLSKTKMKMTAPVRSALNEKLAMTAPVRQQIQGNKWKVQFVMPEGYTLDTLPQPNSSYVHLISIPAKHFLVIRFSGLADEHSLQVHTGALQRYISDQDLKSIGNPIMAFYNPPWTLPFLRRNEVLIEIE